MTASPISFPLSGARMVQTFSMPGMHLVAEVNARENHFKTARRAASQKRTTVLCAKAFLGAVAFPVDVTIVRIGPRPLDSDNLAGSAKHVRDGIAEWLGVDDGVSERDGRVRWLCEQQRSVKGDGGPRCGVVVRIEARR